MMRIATALLIAAAAGSFVAASPAQDVARAGQGTAEGDAVPTLDDLGTGRAQAEAEPSAREPRSSGQEDPHSRRVAPGVPDDPGGLLGGLHQPFSLALAAGVDLVEIEAEQLGHLPLPGAGEGAQAPRQDIARVLDVGAGGRPVAAQPGDVD